MLISVKPINIPNPNVHDLSHTAFYMPCICCCVSYEIMRRCWHYYPKHRPSFFDILQDFEPDMSDRFREQSFYFNQDGGETGSVSDENEHDTGEDVETDHLTRPLNESASGTGNRSASSTPKSSHRSATQRTNDSRHCLPGNSGQDDIADSKKLPSSASKPRVTDRLLATSDSDDAVVSDVACSSSELPQHDTWNGGGGKSADDVPTAINVEADDPYGKLALRNGHIPYNLATTNARC